MTDDMLGFRAKQALQAAQQKLEELKGDEEVAIAQGDAETAVQRRGERVLLEERAIDLAQRVTRHERLVAMLPNPKPARGPQPMVTALEIARKRQELLGAGKPFGERSIAKALGVSRDSVRYALGKDRRK